MLFAISFCILFGVMLYQIHQHDEQFKYKFNPNDNYCKFIYDHFGIDKNYNFSYDDLMKHDDFTYFAHYVTLHIRPDKSEVNVSVKINDSCFQNTQSIVGYTNNNSEVTFPMISTAKYNILIDNNRCSYYIYPSVSYYEIWC